MTDHFIFGVSDFKTTEPLLNFATIIESGMDFIEPGLAKVAAMTDEEFSELAVKLRGSKVRVQSANWFLPPTLKVTGPDVDQAKSREFLQTALMRASVLAAKAVVFGSPGSRSIPEGFSATEARKQIVDFCVLAADVIQTGGFDLRIAVEHVNHTETNFINTFAQALDLVREVNRKEIGLAADFYHFAMENEATDIVKEAGDLICAVQLANPQGRCFPKPGVEVPKLDLFLQQLREIGYTGGVSVEANAGDDLGSDCRLALEALKAL
ncbi:sugar phosphate isomerase/epimerase family protein [Prosthecobacter sp.]|uniref:sugar phosphate isomerase/epimerase family protein n=1 Tax=Prosthecobacter sp. TaxID=1965333 RepID=UPI0037836DC5